VTLPSTQHYARFLQNVRTLFDKEGLENLICIYTEAIKALNLENKHPYDLDALYSIFQVSDLSESFPCSIFKHYYENQYLLMSVHSPLLKDVLAIQ
jgi:hypothetical protein